MEKKPHANAELELVADCLVGFIRKHAVDSSLQGLSLREESVQGRRAQERDDLRFVGDWVVQGVPPRLIARWSADIAQGESMRVEVRLEKRENAYSVVAWDVKNTF